MKKFRSLEELVKTFQAESQEEWIYTNMEQWNNSSKSNEFYIITEDEIDELADDEVYESASGAFLPKELEDQNLYPWILTSTLEGILLNLNGGKNAPLEKIRGAINFYRENDAFLSA